MDKKLVRPKPNSTLKQLLTHSIPWVREFAKISIENNEQFLIIDHNDSVYFYGEYVYITLTIEGDWKEIGIYTTESYNHGYFEAHRFISSKKILQLYRAWRDVYEEEELKYN